MELGSSDVFVVRSQTERPWKWMSAAVLGLLLTFGAGAAGAVTLTMDELSFQPVDGLKFEGVTFGFTVAGSASTDAHYDAANGGQQTATQDPVLEGNAGGVLTLDFDVATATLGFGVSLSVAGALTPGFSVELFDDTLTSLGTTGVNTSVLPGDTFSEGRFNYGGTPVRRAVVTFSGSAPRFALDDLTFGVPEDTGFVPPDKDTGKCESAVATILAKLAKCVAKCHVKQASFALKGKAFDEEACEQGAGKPVSCRTAYNKASASLVAKGTCPTCLGATAQSNLADLMTSFLEQNNGQMYCAGTTPLP